MSKENQATTLILSTGSNLGDRLDNLNRTKDSLRTHFELVCESTIYESHAVDFLDQPQFLNQVLEFKLQPTFDIHHALNICLEIEKKLGRVRNIPKGPRLIDIDILFWGLAEIDSKDLQVPHPRLFERCFILKPLSEMPFYPSLQKHFSLTIPEQQQGSWPYH